MWSHILWICRREDSERSSKVREALEVICQEGGYQLQIQEVGGSAATVSRIAPMLTVVQIDPLGDNHRPTIVRIIKDHCQRGCSALVLETFGLFDSSSKQFGLPMVDTRSTVEEIQRVLKAAINANKSEFEEEWRC